MFQRSVWVCVALLLTVSSLSRGDDDWLKWTSYFGGNHYDFLYASYAGENGVVTGVLGVQSWEDFSIPMCPPGSGVAEALVVRFDPFAEAGQQLIWTTWLNCTNGVDVPFDVVPTDEGGCIVVGVTSSVGFPLVDAFDSELSGEEGFVVELDSLGDIVWSSFIGGSGADRVNHVFVSSATVTIVGQTSSSDFPLVNPYQSQFGGGETDAFVASIDRSTGVPVLEWSTYLGGLGDERTFNDSQTVLVDEAGTVFVAGDTKSSDLPATVGAFQEELSGSASDIFLARFQPAFSGADQLEALTYLGGASSDAAFDMLIDSHGRLVIVGMTYSIDFPTTPGAAESVHGASSDGFFVALSTDLSELLYSTLFSEPGRRDRIAGVAESAAGPFVLGGWASPPSTTHSGSPVSLPAGREVLVRMLAPNSEGASDLIATLSFGEGKPFDMDTVVDGTYLLAGTSQGSLVSAGEDPLDTTYEGWSDGAFWLIELPLTFECPFIRADPNQDGGVDIGDAIATLNYLFQGGVGGACPDSLDANDSGSVDLADAITVLDYLFSGSTIPMPSAGCDVDTTADDLGCFSFDCP